MKLVRILRFLLYLILFILLLVIAANNMQSVEFNFLGIYVLKFPLIVIVAIFSLSGVLIGMLFGLANNLTLKIQISKLKKQIDNDKQNKNFNNNLDNKHIL